MEQRQILTSEGTLHVYIKGNGPKHVVLLHGAGSDHAMLSWREVIDQFDEGYTVVAPDLLGYGQSDMLNSEHGELFYSAHITSINEVLEALSIQHFVIAGLSMGGALAIRYALKYPNKVQACIPVNTWGVTEQMPMHRLSHWSIQRTNWTQRMFEWVEKSSIIAKWFLAYILIADKTKITGALVNEVQEACKGQKAGKSMQQFQYSSVLPTNSYPYYDKELLQLLMPVVFIHGKKDPLIKLKDVQRAADRVPNGELMVFQHCKHWSVKERPEAFYHIIAALETKK